MLEDYANDLRAIIERLRKKRNPPVRAAFRATTLPAIVC